MSSTCNPAEIDKLKSYIDKLNAAIGTGARSVTLGSQTIIYNTTESLIKARNDMRDQLRALESQCGDKGRRSRQSYAVYRGREF